MKKVFITVQYPGFGCEGDDNKGWLTASEADCKTPARTGLHEALIVWQYQLPLTEWVNLEPKAYEKYKDFTDFELCLANKNIKARQAYVLAGSDDR